MNRRDFLKRTLASFGAMILPSRLHRWFEGDTVEPITIRFSEPFKKWSDPMPASEFWEKRFRSSNCKVTFYEVCGPDCHEVPTHCPACDLALEECLCWDDYMWAKADTIGPSVNPESI